MKTKRDKSILDLEWDGLLPLLPLTKGGKRPEIVQIMIDQLVESGDSNLLALSEMFGGLAFTDEAEKAWFKRRFAMFQDIMKDSWVYQEMLEQGRTEEREKRLRDQRTTVVQLVKRDFPALQALAEQQVQNIQDPDVLQNLISQLFATTSIETARKLLLDLRTH